MSSSSSALRRHWRIDPEITFLNHGSFGACPIPVLEKQSELRARMESDPMRFFLREYPDLMNQARMALAQFIGAEPAGLVFVTNATEGVNTALRALGLGTGDQILVPDHAYRACRNALDVVAGAIDARPIQVDLPFPIRNPGEVTAAIVAKITPRTRFALVDHITSPTGLVFPIREIVSELRRRGVETIVDGAHGAGMVPLDLGKLGAAFYTGNCHKWLCTPKGSAFLYVRPDWRDRVRPLSISHPAKGFIAEFDWTGTWDPTPVMCIPEAIRFLATLFPDGWPGLMNHNRTLALNARKLLCDAIGIAPPAPESMIGTLAAMPLPLIEGVEKLPFDPLMDRLYRDHKIEAPVMNWSSPRARILRVAAQAYNDIAQYEKLADVLRAEGTS